MKKYDTKYSKNGSKIEFYVRSRDLESENNTYNVEIVPVSTGGEKQLFHVYKKEQGQSIEAFPHIVEVQDTTSEEWKKDVVHYIDDIEETFE